MRVDARRALQGLRPARPGRARLGMTLEPYKRGTPVTVLRGRAVVLLQVLGGRRFLKQGLVDIKDTRRRRVLQ